MLVRLDPVIDRGVLTMAPTAAGRGWDIEWLRRWLKEPDRPPAHAAVDPDTRFSRGAARGAGGGRDGAGDGLIPHGRGCHGGPGMDGVSGEVCLRRVQARLALPGLRSDRIPLTLFTRPMKSKALPGFRDFYPADFALRAHIFEAWRPVASRYGFEEYDGPPLEPLELYTAKSGDEIVGQLYNFIDKGDRQVALRPEMTPTLARMVAARAGGLRKPIRWFSIPQLFRYERQQRGRLREHFQLNCDLIGEPGPLADAEIIALAIDVMRSFGLGPGDVRVRLSDRRVLDCAAASARTERRRRWPRVPGARQARPDAARGDSGDAARAGRRPGDVDRRARGSSKSATGPSWSGACRRPSWPGRRIPARGTSKPSMRWDWAISSRSTSRSCAAWRTIPERSSSCSTRGVRCVPSAAAGATTTCSTRSGGVELPAVGFGMGDVVLGELLKDRGLLPAETSRHRCLSRLRSPRKTCRTCWPWPTGCATPGSGSSTPEPAGGGQAAQAGRRAERAAARSWWARTTGRGAKS